MLKSVADRLTGIAAKDVRDADIVLHEKDRYPDTEKKDRNISARDTKVSVKLRLRKALSNATATLAATSGARAMRGDQRGRFGRHH
jgi:fructose-specific phosphotransferase system component IIB